MAAYVDSELKKALDLYKSGGAPALQPDILKDWQISSGAPATVPGLGLQAYNLLPTALTLYPVLTPLRNMLPRLQGKGRQSEFKAILGIGNGPAGDALSGVFGTEGQSGAKINPTIEDVLAVYRTLKQAVGVTFEAQWEGQGYLDIKGAAVVNLLRQFMINEERAILYALNSSAAISSQFSAGAVGTAPAATLASVAPSGTVVFNGVTYVAPAANNTGNFAGATAFIRYTIVTGMGESLPSTEQSQAVAANAYLFVGFPTFQSNGFPGIAINIYTNTAGGGELLNAAGAGIAAATTGTAPAVFTQLSASPSGFPVFMTSKGAGAALPGADASASSLAYNGMLAQLYGANKAGVGLGQPGATVLSANAVLAMTGSGTNSLENFLRTIWNNAFADPKWMIMNEVESRAVTRGTLGAGTPYFVNVPVDQLNAATAAFRVSRFTNPVTGSEVEIKVHPYLQQGTVIAGSDAMPQWYVPAGQIPATIALDMVQDYTEIDYPPQYNTASGGDTWNIQVMNLGTFKAFIPALFGVLNSVQPS